MRLPMRLGPKEQCWTRTIDDMSLAIRFYHQVSYSLAGYLIDRFKQINFHHLV